MITAIADEKKSARAQICRIGAELTTEDSVFVFRWIPGDAEFLVRDFSEWRHFRSAGKSFAGVARDRGPGTTAQAVPRRHLPKKTEEREQVDGRNEKEVT